MSTTPKPIGDQTLPREDTALASGPHRMKLGIFGANLSGGNGAITTAPVTPMTGTWGEVKKLAQSAEDAGFDVLVPIGRFKGFNSPSQFWDRSLDTFAWASAVAAVTEKISIFSTCLVPLIHPVHAAKLGATVDMVAEGRWGLNVVPGWIGSEFEMFGKTIQDRDARYAYAEEWLEIVTRLWTEDEEFDFTGEHFDLKGLISKPKPMQTPRPTIMNAGASPVGQDFAVRNADMIFASLFFDDQGIRDNVDQIRETARSHGKETQIWGTLGVVVRPTEKEANDYVEWYAGELGDRIGAERFAATVMGGDSASMDGMRADPELVKGLMQSSGNRRFVGTPEQLVEEIQLLSDMGIDGLALTWADYDEGIAQFADELMPMLREAGLRAG